MDTILQVFQAVGYLLLLVLLLVLWRKFVQRQEVRAFWFLLALALTINLLGNIAWIIHDMVTGKSLNTFSAIDLFYVSRYILIGIALWSYPLSLSRKAGIWTGIVTVMVTVLIWVVYFPPAMKLRGGDGWGFLGVAMYPALDTALIVLAWFRVLQNKEKGTFFLLLLFSMVSYGIANTLNLIGYVFPSLNSGVLPNIFWILTDVLLLIMAFRDNEIKKIRNEK
ncbi:MAG TPA: hypothetical protein PLL95_17240 [Anaerolineales bacterium]|nr:hypothetical protein [Anaerolineales bacterium]